jgi:hypothetical protein
MGVEIFLETRFKKIGNTRDFLGETEFKLKGDTALFVFPRCLSRPVNIESSL